MLIKKGKGRLSFSEHKRLTVQIISFKKQKKRTLRGCRGTIILLGVLKPVRVLPHYTLMGVPKCFCCARIIWNLGQCQSFGVFLNNLIEIWFADLKLAKLISGITGWVGSSIMCWISPASKKFGCKVQGGTEGNSETEPWGGAGLGTVKNRGMNWGELGDRALKEVGCGTDLHWDYF